jgi:hypothetical protein
MEKKDVTFRHFFPWENSGKFRKIQENSGKFRKIHKKVK